MRRHFAGQRDGQRDDSSLARVIRRVSRRGTQKGRRGGDVHNAAGPFCRHQPANHFATGEKRAGQIHVQRLRPHVERHVCHWARGTDRRIVDQHVDRSEVSLGLVEHAATSASRDTSPPTANRCADRVTFDRCDDRRGLIGSIAEIHHHSSPFGGKTQADSAAQSPRSARHDRHLAVQIQIHGYESSRERILTSVRPFSQRGADERETVGYLETRGCGLYSPLKLCESRWT